MLSLLNTKKHNTVESFNAKRKNRKTFSEEDVRSLLESNRILKEHLEFLRAKLKKTESLLELYIKAEQKKEKEKKDITINYSLN